MSSGMFKQTNMHSSAATRRNPISRFQSTKSFPFERFLSPEKSAALHRTMETCATLLQKQGIHSVIDMNTAGFYYTGRNDTARCDDCQLEVSNWTLDMKPFTIHKQRNPTCSYVLSILTDKTVRQLSMISLPSSDTDEALHNNHQRNLLFEAKKMLQTRAQTFAHWPHETSPSSAQMIAAGFCYCNVGDRVICLYCNLICQQWMPKKDDPWKVHQLYSPRCPFIIALLEHPQETSNMLIREIIARTTCRSNGSKIPEQTNIKHAPWFPHLAYAGRLCLAELYWANKKLGRPQPEYDIFYNEEQLVQLIKDRLDLPVSKNLVDDGFDPSIIESCLEHKLRSTGNDFFDDCDLQMACTILQKQIECIDGNEENIIILNAPTTTTMLDFLDTTALECVSNFFQCQ